jgi:hypothetical protein
LIVTEHCTTKCREGSTRGDIFVLECTFEAFLAVSAYVLCIK